MTEPEFLILFGAGCVVGAVSMLIAIAAIDSWRRLPEPDTFDSLDEEVWW